MAKQTLGLEMKQQQKLSPLQIQTIKIIELPVAELEQRIRKELEENPVLDEDTHAEDENREDDTPREVSIESIDENDPTPSYKLYVNNYGKDERPEYNTFSVKESFTQSLLEQLGFRELDDHQRKVAAFIICSLDEDGYLRRPLDNLVDDMDFRSGIKTTEKEAEQMLMLVQEFEPVGIGARSLQECLSLQLKAKKQTEAVVNARLIVDEYFDEFSNRHFQKILSKTGLSEDDFKQAQKAIAKLNPSPGGQVDDSYNDQAQQIIPDFVLKFRDNGELYFEMPRFSIPELKINRSYSAILEEAAVTNDRAKKEAATFIKQKIDSAKWFMEAIKQRHNTLHSTMSAILEFQYEYFLDGDETHLKPMVLKDIAEKTGFDISTISRVVNSKYIETHFGIFSLKSFFSEGMANSDGEEISTKEIKKVLLDSVENENKKKPLTDDQLVETLASKGYVIARRTIAKYRDQLGIPKARLRKEL